MPDISAFERACTCMERTVKKGCPSSWVVFVSYAGNACVLGFGGPEADYMHESAGLDAWFESNENGVWVWRGTLRTVYYAGSGDYDCETVDEELRQPTEEEWESIREEDFGMFPGDDEYYETAEQPCPMHGTEGP